MTLIGNLPDGIILQAMDCANDGIVITEGNTSNRPIVYVNQSFCRLTGYTADEILGQDCRFLQGAQTDRETLENLRGALARGHPARVRLLNYRKDGSTFWNELSISPVRDDRGLVTHHIGMQKDITDLVEYEASLQALVAQLEQDSHTDPLTGLLNRRGLEMAAAPAWGHAVRAGSWISLLFVDIDHFKAVNDRFGHTTGDACLKAVAERIGGVRARDSDIAARYGGEEFLIVAQGLDESGCRKLAKRLVSELQIPIPGHTETSMTVSIGAVCLTPSLDDSLLQAIDQADRAMYAAKQAGRNQAMVFTPTPRPGSRQAIPPAASTRRR